MRVSDGETRTRTGDTTIFSRAALMFESGRFAGDSPRSQQVSGVRIFADFALVSPALRQTARTVCLFIGAPGAMRKKELRADWRSAAAALGAGRAHGERATPETKTPLVPEPIYCLVRVRRVGRWAVVGLGGRRTPPVA